MALTVFTDRPTSSTLGSVATIGGGAGSAHAAVSDNSTATYVQLASQAVIDSQICRLGFTVPGSLPAGAKILSVGIRRQVLPIVTGNPIPQCLHWHRSVVPADPAAPLGSVATPYKDPFQTSYPDSTTGTPFTEPLGDRRTTPDGQPWDLTTNLLTFTYDMGKGDTAGSLRVYEVYRDITYQQLSTVAVASPSGTVSGTRPTVTGSYASPDSQPLEAFQVAVYKQADTLVGGFVPFGNTPLQQSGWILAEDIQWQLTDDLVDGIYVVYIQGRAQWEGSGDFVTAIASGTFTRTASGTFPPNAILQSATFDLTRNRVVLTMLPSSASPTTVAYTVQASRDGGQSWQTRPSLTLITATGMTPVTRYDRFFDVGVTMQYRVLSYAATTPNAAAAFSNTISVATAGSDWWIRHPGNELLDTKIELTPKGLKLIRDRVMGTFSVLSRNGRVNKVVVYGPTYGNEGEVEFLFNGGEVSATYWDSYDQLDQASVPLFVQQPNGTSEWWCLGPGSSGRPTKVTPLFVPGNSSAYRQRKVETGFTAVDPPNYF